MPDAWFCVNSGLSFYAQQLSQSAGYTIPDDISIICFDETEFTRMAIPRLTNVATNLEFMGQLAIRTLITPHQSPRRTNHPSADRTGVEYLGSVRVVDK